MYSKSFHPEYFSFIFIWVFNGRQDTSDNFGLLGFFQLVDMFPDVKVNEFFHLKIHLSVLQWRVEKMSLGKSLLDVRRRERRFRMSIQYHLKNGEIDNKIMSDLVT